jgi:hypothetical protein
MVAQNVNIVNGFHISAALDNRGRHGGCNGHPERSEQGCDRQFQSLFPPK